MGKLYWLGALFVLGLGLFTAWYVADQRQNQILLKPQSFQTADELLKTLEPFLEPSLQGRKWIFLGLELQNRFHGELAQLLTEKHKNRVVILDHFLQGDYQGRYDFVMNLQHSRDKLLADISDKANDRDALVIAPNIYFSHIPFDSLSNTDFADLSSMQYTVLTMTSFPLGEDEIRSFYLPCSESQQLQTSLSDMGCYVRRQAILRQNELSKIPIPHGFFLRLNDSEFVLFTRSTSQRDGEPR